MCDCSLFESCGDCCNSTDVLKALNGDDGQDGNSVYTGIGAPSNSLSSNYIVYIDKNSPFNIYFRNDNGVNWDLNGPLKGLDGNGFLISNDFYLSASEIDNLYAIPKQILPGLPPDYFYDIISVISRSGNGTAWVGGSQITIGNQYAAYMAYLHTDALTEANSIYKGQVNSVQLYLHNNPSTSTSGLMVFNPPGDISGGSLDLKIKLVYQICKF